MDGLELWAAGVGCGTNRVEQSLFVGYTAAAAAAVYLYESEHAPLKTSDLRIKIKKESGEVNN